MKLIELHNGGLRYSLNVDFITAVALLDEGGCSVWVLGEPDDRPNTCDESYEEVIRLIQDINADRWTSRENDCMAGSGSLGG